LKITEEDTLNKIKTIEEILTVLVLIVYNQTEKAVMPKIIFPDPE